MQGFLIVRGLVGQDEVEEPKEYVDGLIYSRVDVPSLQLPLSGARVEEIERRYLLSHTLHH